MIDLRALGNLGFDAEEPVIGFRSVTEAFLDTVRDFGVRVEFDPYPGTCFGPRHCGVHFEHRSLLLGYERKTIRPSVYFDDALHEFCHLILGRSSILPLHEEAWILLPYEWHLANWILGHRSILECERDTMLGLVEEYQMSTQVGGWKLGSYGPHVRESEWWLDGLRRCVYGGLLTPNGEPTFNVLRSDESHRLHELCVKWEPPHPSYEFPVVRVYRPR